MLVNVIVKNFINIIVINTIRALIGELSLSREVALSCVYVKKLRVEY